MGEMSGDGRALERKIKELLAQHPKVSTLRGLARETHIGTNTMGYWFRGVHSPGTGTLERVAGALDVPVSVLWDAYGGRETIGVSDAALTAIEQAVERGVLAALRRWREEGGVP